MVTIPQSFRETPVTSPLVGTLLDAATVTDGVGYLETEGIALSYNCIDLGATGAWPCPANLLAAPTMTAPSTNTTGGTLAAGTYRAVLTAITSRGETVKSNEVSQVTTGSTSRVIWNWTDLPSETGYRLYVTTTNGATGTQQFLVALAAGTTTYNWTGTPAYNPTGGAPPSTSTAVIPTVKTFNELGGYQDGLRFVVYGGIKCRSVGFDEAEAVSEVRRVFEAKESVGVARELAAQRFIASASNWAAPTDVTPAAGAVSPKVGLALLEQAAGATYAGTPTIHVPRSVGALLWESVPLNERGGIYYSPQGSKIASDAGYGIANKSPAGVAAPAGEAWLYATGEVSIVRGELQGPHFALSQGQSGIDDNEVRVLVERPYVAWVDCFAAAVRVKVE